MVYDEVSVLLLRAESLGDPPDELDTVKGLFKICPCTRGLCPPPPLGLWERRHEDDGQPMAFHSKTFLKIEPAHPRQLYIRDQAGGPREIARRQKGLRGGKGESDETQGRNQAFRRDATGFIIVYNGYDWVLGQLSHFS